MIRRLIFALGLAACCHCRDHTQLAPPVLDSAVRSCGAGVVLMQDSLCPDVFTSDGVACISCRGAAGCFEKTMGVYCAAGPPGCLGDPLCKREDARRRP